MINFSKLKPLIRFSNTITNRAVSRPMSDVRTFPLVPSRWQWRKFKDLLHFYVLLGVIPLTIITTAANVFVGPATLSEIPEDYVPKHWEYYRSPISRFIARYIASNPQQEYEKYLSFLYIENEKKQLRKIEKLVKQKIAERQDYQAYYYRPILAKYYRKHKEASDYVDSLSGD